MFVLRPVREKDLAALIELARSIGGGLTTLPADENFLGDRIDSSLQAFSPRVKKPGGENYFFVLEDLSTGEIVGTSAIASRVGGFDPFYTYELRAEKFVHAPLKISKEMLVLHLKETHRGPSEIGSLYLRRNQRRGGLGRLLSLARFLFIGAFPKRFDPTVIAELRGYIDQEGKSPFWECVARPFFENDFSAADFMSGLGQKEFIADLMPRHPIYVTLLPAAVQAVIGRVHHETEAALALLLAEGFTRTAQVDIFDAGPLVQAEVSQLRTIKTSRTAVLKATSTAVDLPKENTHLIANAAIDFRACLAPAIVDEEGVTLPAPAAEALQLTAGGRVVFAPLR